MRLSSRVAKINPSETLAITALKYLAIEDMIAAIGLPADQLCLHYWLSK